MKIVLASRNRKKIGELRTILSESFSELEILSLDDVGILDEIEEDGKSFEENALIKARVAATSGYIGVGDDSGLTVDVLGGDPGIYSARYAGGHDDADNNRLILKNLKDVPAEKRSAHFVSVIACVFPDGREIVARGECPGTMLFDYRGNGGFGYDPVFFVPALKKTFSQLSAEEKNAISHRGKALEIFKGKLEEYLK